jgi:hypothetical protein
MQLSVLPASLQNCTDEEWRARVDLAAEHRIACRQGLSEGIFNHLTFVVSGRDDRYYRIPFGTHWSEVTASTFMEVGIDDGEVKRGEATSSAPAIAFTRRSTRRCRRPRRCFMPTYRSPSRNATR